MYEKKEEKRNRVERIRGFVRKEGGRGKFLNWRGREDSGWLMEKERSFALF